MKNLFIDSNIWLSLYHFTGDDLAQFEKLKELIGTDIKLYIPQQVHDEVARNREVKLKDALKEFEICPIQYPVFCKGYEEFSAFSNDFKDIIKRFKAWKTKIETDIKNRNLPADQTIKNFFDVCDLIPCDEVVDKAYSRYKIGNPPGKDNKYGDAINWECLLNAVPDGEDLYLISADKDYRSQIFDDMFNPFLKDEWESCKGSSIIFYKNLVPFLKEHFQDIQLRSEQEKEELINNLKYSHNFASTHGTIAMMDKHSGWTDSQIEAICAAAEENSQVNWILTDDDVLNFYAKLLSKVKYGDLSDCATKRVMELIFEATIQRESEARATAEADAADALEEYYKH